MSTLKPGLYRHFKGNLYRLLYVAKHSETMEDMVVYQALYGEMGIWVRPAAMWRNGWTGTITTGPGFIRSRNENKMS